MPTFVAFKKGERIGDLTGAVPAKLTVSRLEHITSVASDVRLCLIRCPLNTALLRIRMNGCRCSDMRGIMGSMRLEAETDSAVQYEFHTCLSHTLSRLGSLFASDQCSIRVQT